MLAPYISDACQATNDKDDGTWASQKDFGIVKRCKSVPMYGPWRNLDFVFYGTFSPSPWAAVQPSTMPNRQKDIQMKCRKWH